MKATRSAVARGLPFRPEPAGAVALHAATRTTVRPARERVRNKTDGDDKAKKPAGTPAKKPPVPRKAPARGRYVDEYARPAA